MPPKKRLTVAESRAIEAKKLKEFEQKRAEMKAKIESKKALQASEARAYNQTQRKIKEDQEKVRLAEMERQKYDIEHPEEKQAKDDDHDRELMRQFDPRHLKNGDIRFIDQIRSDRIRSRLQHEYNLETSNFYKVRKDVNMPTNDDLVAGIYDTVLGEIPYVKDVKNALGISVTNNSNDRVRNHFNKAYEQLVEQYPELADGPYNPDNQLPSGGSLKAKVQCKTCNKTMNKSSYKKHTQCKTHLARIAKGRKKTK